MSSCCPVDPEVTNQLLPLWLQAISIGSILVLGHCAGMCGPLLASFRFGPQEGTRLNRMRSAALELGAYQSGRAITYASAGAIVGYAGDALIPNTRLAATLTLAVGIILLVSLVILPLFKKVFHKQSIKLQKKSFGLNKRWNKTIQHLLELTRPLTAGSPLRKRFALGLLMSLLPCGLPLWFLTLAAASSSALHGAGFMLALVVMSSVPLFIAVILPHFSAKRGAFAHARTFAMSFSGIWLMLIGLAGLQIIPHMQIVLGPITATLW